LSQAPIQVLPLDPFLYEIPRFGAMRVPGRIYASASQIRHLVAHEQDALRQVANVACLPGIVGWSLAMPDIHMGYGFPIGGVAATDPAQGGVISPGGVGYDINCGVRLVATGLQHGEMAGRLPEIARALYRAVPCGVGSEGAIAKLSSREIDRVAAEGAGWAVGRGFGQAEDLKRTEEEGCLAGALPSVVSDRARARGATQVGTLGSGNHFLEIDVVDEVVLPDAAAALGLRPGQLVLAIHSGSRGFGHQICDDFLARMEKSMARTGIRLPDRQLACAPLDSPEAKEYLGAMRAAANFAWANRQAIMALAEEAIATALGMTRRELGLSLVYDVCHNIAKFESHTVDGVERRVCVHRKGATRAFPPGHRDVPERYRAVGQPVLIPGDMGRCSWVLVGAAPSMERTFGSTCHGAGRIMSRMAARRAGKGRDLVRELAGRGVTVLAKGRGTVAEEMPEAYKDVSEVVDVMDQAGISRKVARLKPLAVIKG
jgi:tRNA-splicing ligase RtcB (3'-phosphate/5'-hydroxy nucleic acid ligase)